MADLPPLGTTAVEVVADSTALDKAFEQEIPRKARAGAERAGQTFGSEMARNLSSSIQARQAEIKNALDKGLISQEQARDLAKRAARGFTTEFNRNIRELGKQGISIDIVDEAKIRSEIGRLSNLIPREMRNIGDRGGREISDSLQRGLTAGLSGLRGIMAATLSGAIVFAGVQVLQAAGRLARRIGQTIREGIERGSQAQQRREAFGALASARGLDQDEVIRTLRRETRLLVSDFDLLRQANFALQAGLPATADQLGELANIARRTARAVGRDATDAYDRLINSIAKGERRVLDELGIIVSFDDAHRAFATSIGKTRDELTAQEQIQARLNVVLEQGRQKVAALGAETLTAAERLTQLVNVTGNLRDRTLELLVQAPAVVRFFESIGIFAEDSAGRIDELAVRIGALILTIGQSVGALKDLIGSITSPIEFGFNLGKFREDFDQRLIQNLADLNAVLERTRELDAIRRESNRVALLDRDAELALQQGQLKIEREITDERLRRERAGLERQIAEQPRGTRFPNLRRVELQERLNRLEEESAAQERDRASTTDRLARIDAERAAISQRIAELTADGRRELEGTKREARDVADILKEMEARLRLIGNIKVSEPVIDLRTRTQRQADVLKGVVDELFPEIRRRVEEATGLGSFEAIRRADATRFRAAAEEIIKSSDSVGKKMLALNGIFMEFGLTAEDLPPFLREAAEAQGLFGEELGKGKDEADGLEATLDEIERGARGLLRAADAAGILSDDLRNALEGAVELSSAIRDIATNGLSLGNIAQGIGGAISFVSGVGNALGIGDPQGAKERRELVEAIDRWRRDVVAAANAFLAVPGRILTAIERALRDIPEVRRGVVDTAGVRRDALRALRAQGITSEDIRRLESEFDIELDEVRRALDGASVDASQFADEIRALQEAFDLDAIRQFFETFRGQMDLLQREVDILDLSPEEELERTRKLFKDFETGIGDELAGLDLTTEEGRAEAERIIEEAFKAGITDPEALLALAGNLSPEEFLDLLGRIETLLDEQGAEAELQSTSQGGVFRGVSIGQGDALIALGQTQVAHLQDIAISARELAGRPLDSALLRPLGIGQPTGGPPGVTPRAPTPPPIPTDVGRLATPAPSFSVAVTVGSVGPFQVTGANGESAVREAVDLSGRRLAQIIEGETRDRLENRGVT